MSRCGISIARCLFAILVGLGAFAFHCQRGEAKKIIDKPRRFSFKIDPATPLADLLPTPPKDWPMLPSYLSETFAQVPELSLGAPVAKISDTEKDTAHIIAKINHLNNKDPDGFLKSLRANRAELRGLPFLLRKDCRTDVKQAQLFTEVTGLVHRSEEAMRSDRFPVPADYWQEFDAQWRSKPPPEVKYYRHEANRDAGERAKVAA
jgi:hypothetical protein